MSARPPNTDDESHIETSSAVEPDDPPVGAIAVGETEALISSEGEIRSGKLAGKSMWAAIWILALPVLLQQTMAACVGLADKIMAGGLPDQIVVAALDGLGIGAYVGWFIGIAMTGLGIGGQALIARAIGAGELRQSRRALGQAMMLSVFWGALVGVALWLAGPPLGALCKLSPDAARFCTQYIRILAYAMPLTGIMMVGAMCLHGAGETTKPSAIAIAVNVLNILLSWALSGADLRFGEFLFENPFGFDLHVIGIAVGTAVSYGLGAVLTLWVLLVGVKDMRLDAAELALDPPVIKRIVRIGVPNFCEGISMWAVNIFVLMFIGRIAATAANGEGLQGAHIIAIQWEAFSFMPGFAIGTAAGALAGQYLGAKNPQMAQRAILACTGLAMLVMGLVGVLFIFGGAWLTRVVSTQEIHLENAPDLLLICGVMQVFFAITMVLRQGLRGVGDTTWTFIITTISSYGVRLPAAYLFGVTLGYGLKGVWIGLCGEFAVRAALFSARFFHGGWKRIKV
ncbi:MAG: MATE family efflux transporter [Planctomycetota bacterium]|nr:MATE family efflux transporter [Planctomycetota bacterium]